MDGGVPTLPELVQYIQAFVYIVGIYVCGRLGKHFFDMWLGFNKSKKVDGYKRETDEYVKKFYEASTVSSRILNECVELHRNQGRLIQKQTDMLERYFTSAMEFRVTLNGQMDLMDERLKDISHRVNEISGKR